MNTYGVCSVNRRTFNTSCRHKFYYPEKQRNIVITALRLNNVIFNVLGYMTRFSPVSGCMRMGIGLAIVGVTLVVGAPYYQEGIIEPMIAGPWYYEALGTGTTQIARGALEAFVPFGWVVNMALDVIATPINLRPPIPAIEGCKEVYDHGCSHKDVSYGFPFFLLRLV